MNKPFLKLLCFAFGLASISSCKKPVVEPVDNRWKENEYISYFWNEQNFSDVVAVSTTKIYVTSIYNKIFLSTDKGKNFKQQNILNTDPVYGHWNSICFSRYGNLVVGDEGAIANESDNGDGSGFWLKSSFNSDYNLYGIASIKDYVWIIGNHKNGTSNSRVYASDNGGSSYINFTIPFKKMYGIYFWNENNGWIVGDGSILKSTDKGLTWKAKYNNPDAALRDIRFFDANHGFACGFDGLLIKTTDGGNTWIAVSVPSIGGLLDMDFTPSGHIWIAGWEPSAEGDKGVLLFSEDKGLTWNKHTYKTKPLFAIDFIDDKVGVAVGEGIIIRTETGGK